MRAAAQQFVREFRAERANAEADRALRAEQERARVAAIERVKRGGSFVAAPPETELIEGRPVEVVAGEIVDALEATAAHAELQASAHPLTPDDVARWRRASADIGGEFERVWNVAPLTIGEVARSRADAAYEQLATITGGSL